MKALPLLFLLAACSRNAQTPKPGEAPDWAALRQSMVAEQIEARGIENSRVLAAMNNVPRHEFVPLARRHQAYNDRPLPIGEGQTISQPYIVAFMAEVADLGPDSKVLEIGTGSGYGAAVLAQVAKEVYTIEILEPLAKRADETLKRLGYTNIRVKHGDGYRGWPDQAPFDAIVVTAAPPYVPEPLKQQLKVGGHLVIPVGKKFQDMRVLTRTEDGFAENSVLDVRFVPMTGEVQDK